MKSMKRPVTKEKALAFLEEGLSIEDIPNFTNLAELEALILESDLDSNVKRELKKRLFILFKDSATHSRNFSHLMKYVAESGKRGF